MHIILTCATPSVFCCLGARGGYALNNVKFLPNSCAKQTHSFQLPSRSTELGFGSRLLFIQRSRFLVFWPLRGAHFRNSFLREVSQPSKLLCFVLFHSGICLPGYGLCAMFPLRSQHLPQTEDLVLFQILGQELSMSVSIRTLG